MKSLIDEFQSAIDYGDPNAVQDYYARLHPSLVKLNEKYNLFASIVAPSINTKVSPPEGTLAFVPYSAKDNICTAGVETRAGSRILEGYIPPFDATVIERAAGEGAILIGKTNMDEFGFGTFSTNSAFGVPRNPFDLKRSCGGSSGGAAGLTAILKYHFALGVSTGGSISCPASFCGVVGLTPTYGRVSRYGLIDYANSLDKIGVLARSTADAEKVLCIIAGKDERDPTSTNIHNVDIEPWHTMGRSSTFPVRVAIPRELLADVDEEVLKVFWNAVHRLEGEDVNIEFEELSLPVLKYAVPAYYLIATAEASTNLAKFCGIRYGARGAIFNRNYNAFFTQLRTDAFGQEAKRRILLGTFARMAGYRDQYYLKALRVRAMMIDAFAEVFKNFNFIASPTMPIVAPRFDEIAALSPITIYMLDFLTIPPNLTGHPHISLPAGYSNGLPVGMQFTAPHWEEAHLISIGKTWETMFEYRYPENVGEIK